MLYQRLIADRLTESLLHSGKVTLLYGPRQAGKTTLAKQVITTCGLRTLHINAGIQQKSEKRGNQITEILLL